MKKRKEKEKKVNRKRLAIESILENEASIHDWNEKLRSRKRFKKPTSADETIESFHNASRKRVSLKMRINNTIFSQEKMQPSQDVILPSNPNPKPISQHLSVPATGKPNATARGAIGTSALAKVQGMQQRMAEMFMRSFLRYQKFFEATVASAQPVLIPARTSDAVLAPVIRNRIRAGSVS